MDPRLREAVRRRAGDVCEYCRIPQAAAPLIPFHIEHIVSRQHGGTHDPDTHTVAALFSQRRDAWTDHFVVRGGAVLGLTPAGRATVRLLNMNAPRRVELRRECQRN